MEITFNPVFAHTLTQAFPAASVLVLPLNWQFVDSDALQSRYTDTTVATLRAQRTAALAQLDDASAAGRAMRVWWHNGVNDVCGFLWLCRRLTDSGVALSHVHAPTHLPNWQVPNTLVTIAHLGELTPADAQTLARREQALDAATMRAYGYGAYFPDASVRVLLNGQIVGVSCNFYDQFLLAALPPGSARTTTALVGDAMQRQLDVPDWWYRARLDALVTLGTLTTTQQGSLCHANIDH